MPRILKTLPLIRFAKKFDIVWPLPLPARMRRHMGNDEDRSRIRELLESACPRGALAKKLSGGDKSPLPRTGQAAHRVVHRREPLAWIVHDLSTARSRLPRPSELENARYEIHE